MCNDLALALRRAPLVTLPATIPWKLFRHVAFSASRGFLKPCLEGIAAFVKASPQIWKSRRPVGLATLRAFRRLSA